MVVGLNANLNEYRVGREVQISVVSDDQALIKLIPIKPYAKLEDGRLLIEFGNSASTTGLSPDSKYVFDKVFCIAVNSWESREVLLKLSVIENYGIVKIYSPDSLVSKSPEDASSEIIIPLNETSCVGFVINTKSVKLGTYTAKIKISATGG